MSLRRDSDASVLSRMYIQADTSCTGNLLTRIPIREDRNLEIQPRPCFPIPRNGGDHGRGTGPPHTFVVLG